MQAAELEEVSCFADGHLCISNKKLKAGFLMEGGSLKPEKPRWKFEYCATKVIIGRFA